MVAIEIQNIKKIMQKLLLGEAFDRFQLIEANITTGNSFYISGAVHSAFYEDPKEIKDPYSLWKNLRPYCYEVIKGKQTPLKFKFVFSMREQDIRRYMEQNNLEEQADNISSMSFVLTYDRSRAAFTGEKADPDMDTDIMVCTTGMARNTFSLDKTPEKLWDATVEQFIRKLED